MSSYSLLPSPLLSPPYYPAGHYASYSGNVYESTLAHALKDARATPRAIQALRPQAASLYLASLSPPQNQSLFFSHHGPYGLPSPDDSASTYSRSESPASQPLSERPYTLESHGPMLPGAIAPSTSMDDIWAFPSNASPRHRERTTSSIFDGPYIADVYTSPSAGYVSSPVSLAKPASRGMSSSSMDFHGYSTYSSYLDAPLGSMSGSAEEPAQPDSYYEGTTALTTPYTSLRSYHSPIQALDPRDACQYPASVSPSSLAHALSPSLSEACYPASTGVAAQSDDELPAYPSAAYGFAPSEASCSTNGDAEMEDEYPSDSGSEYNDDGDDDYGARPRRRGAHRSRVASDATDDEDAYGTVGPIRNTRPRAAPLRMPVPQPIPNLTKKSRGRRVPTASSTVTRVCTLMWVGASPY
jgi:hypothetical protein